MAVVSTLLAGLASSEMTRAQYDRALAAQLQSKAGDQWNLFQGKKLRGALRRTELDPVGTTAEVHPLDRAALLAGSADSAGAAFGSAAGERALTALVEGKLPWNPDPGLNPMRAFRRHWPRSPLFPSGRGSGRPRRPHR